MKNKEILTNNKSKEFATVSQKKAEPIILLDEFEKEKNKDKKLVQLQGILTSGIRIKAKHWCSLLLLF